MSTQKHTQGPWRSNYPQITTQEGMALTVAVVLSREDNNPRADSAAKTKTEAEANAHLIAAAPDLLAALKLALPCVEYAEIETASKGQNEAHDKCLSALEWIRAAIAKAEGAQ